MYIQSNLWKLLPETFPHEVNKMHYVQALIVNALLIMIIPRIITKPIGVQVVDDFVMYLRAQQAFLISSSAMLALVLYLTNYWIEKSSNDLPTSSPVNFRVRD